MDFRPIRHSLHVVLLSGSALSSLPSHALAQQATQLERLEVEAGTEGVFDQEGYVAKKGRLGSKTDTPLIETPQSVSVVTADEIEARGAETLGTALRYTPSVNGELWGGDLRGYGIQMRGFEVSSDAFYVDGLKLRGTNFAAFIPLDIYGAEGLEVLRGPSSVLYGQAGPGGIVNYVSKRPTGETFREIEVGAGSFDRYQGQSDMGGKLDEAGVWTYRMTGLYRDGDTFIDHVEDDRIFLAPSLKWQPDADTSLTLFAKYQKDNQGWGIQFLPAKGTVLPNPNGTLPASHFVGEPGFDRYDTSMAMLGYEFEHRFNDTWTVRQNARYAYLHNEAEGIFGGGANPNPDLAPGLDPDGRTYYRYADGGLSRIGTFGIDNQVEAAFDTGQLSHTLLLGLDYQYTDFSDRGTTGDAPPIDIFDPVFGQPLPPLSVYTDVDTTQSQVGVYAQDQVKFGNWVLSLGGRHDWAKTDTLENLDGTTTSQSDSAFSGRAGLVYLSDIGLAPYVSYSTSFLPELATNPAGGAFEPETGEQYEVGVKYQPDGWNSFVTVSAFDLRKQNVVRSFGNVSTQTGEIRSRGIEVEGVASLGMGLDLKAAYAYLDTQITDDAEGTGGNVPYGVPHHRASLWADYTFRSGRLEGLGFGAGVRYIGSSYGDDANSFKVPAATLVDAAVHYDWKDFQFKLNVSNLFDKKYVATCYAESNGCFYGESRKISGSVKYRW
ncbi:TonB-dependent siderophore receptor [Chelativorans xinjiangense]|uniref:TonB-dependent siderophore receptor n=1 Tax=Chelativorans xinjiangense TaxID=2681485 RepID=UPI0013576C3A|nr:TonB-dependent siderophore receptor [Chelativorans xinjiangense]